MIYRVLISEDVLAELSAAHFWYESKSIGLGFEFDRTFYTAIKRIADFPFTGPYVNTVDRRILVHRFPYALYYCVKAHDVQVLGLFHASRDLKFVRKSLKERRSK